MACCDLLTSIGLFQVGCTPLNVWNLAHSLTLWFFVAGIVFNMLSWWCTPPRTTKPNKTFGLSRDWAANANQSSHARLVACCGGINGFTPKGCNRVALQCAANRWVCCPLISILVLLLHTIDPTAWARDVHPCAAHTQTNQPTDAVI